MTEREQVENEIRALKSLLADTDYTSYKLIEDLVNTLQDSSPTTLLLNLNSWLKDAVSKYGEIIRVRAAWREKINMLESQMDEEETDSA